ncbi:Fe2+ or Zn2+ uptake regulation protein [Elusimicrobium posterum]|uniref:transcriptional repressor n=1 Tax=Elusimicrobium posterum TaxID=3116653 RepID=UPI003C75254B
MGGSEHFDHNTHDHAHFYCEQCSKVFDLELPHNFAKLLKEFEAENKIDVKSTELVVRGLCNDCKCNK